MAERLCIVMVAAFILCTVIAVGALQTGEFGIIGIATGGNQILSKLRVI